MEKPEKEYLICPNCLGEQRLNKTQCDKDLYVDLCSHCGGIWLDAGELSQLVRLGRFYIENLDSGGEAGIISHVRECPYCEVVLQPHHPKPAPQVTIDRCPDCKGIWLDMGELRKLAAR